MNALLIAVMVSLSAAGQLTPTASAPAKQSPPPPAAPKDFKLPERRELTLDNGLRVTLVQYGQVPKVDAHLAIRTGNVHETETQTWLADLTADMLVEGTTSRSAEQINQEAATMGGFVSTEVSPDETTVRSRALAEFGPKLIALIADVARNPAFPASELERLKSDRKRMVAIMRSQPQALAEERFLQVMYPNHAYGRMFPSEAMLDGYEVEDVRGFYDANYGARRAHLYVVGQYDPAAMEAAIRQAFGDWKAGAEPKDLVPTPVAKRVIHLVDRPGAVQSTVMMGVPVIDPSHADYVKFQAMNALLGGMFSSRITANIREAKGYTYSPYAGSTNLRKSAHWAARADVTTNVTGPSLKEIFFEIDRLQKAPPTAAEVQAVKNYLAGTFILSLSARDGIIARLRFADLHDLPADYLDTYVQKVMAVTPADFQAMAKAIDTSKMLIVVAGDRKQVETQVRPYGQLVVMPAAK